MRRDAFLKTCAALLASGALPLTAEASANLKMMIPKMEMMFAEN
jgi:putative tricarboxylic transport membrane protein